MLKLNGESKHQQQTTENNSRPSSDMTMLRGQVCVLGTNVEYL